MRPTKKLRALLLGSTTAVAVLLVSAGSAGAAQRCEAPPGTAGVDQYCETVPDAKGDRESGAGKRIGRSLDRGTSRALGKAGRDGEGVLALPTSGQGGRAGDDLKGSEVSGPEKQEFRKEPSESSLGALGSAIESGSTAGPGFIWFLVAAGVGMAGIAWIRYRRGSSE